MKKGLLLILVALACLFFVMPSNKANATNEKEVKINFATTAQRVKQDANTQIWAQDFLTFTNNKTASSNAIIDSSNPVRLYQNSEVVIEQGDMLSILFDCNSADYATALKNSIGTVTGATVSISSDKVTVVFASAQDTFKVAKLTAQVRLDSLTVSYIGEESIESDDPTWGSLKDEFEYYYNHGQYVKDTVINIDTKKVGFELENLVHAYNVYEKIDTEKTTTYCGDYLYFENGNGYGTQGDQLTSITMVNNKPSVTTVHSSLPGMETYYLTLKDFLLGIHTSKHTNDTSLNLTQEWIREGDVYVSENADVIAAFVLFTAPTWLQLEADDYLDYSKATVEINKEGNLVMKLWVSLGDKEGKLVDSAETDEENAVFSYATIYDSNIAFADLAAAKVATLGKDLFEDLNLETTLEGYEGVTIEWSGEGVSNNVLSYLNPSEDTVVSLTATVTYKHQTRVVENIEFTHKVAVVVEPDQVQLLATFNLGANGSASHNDGSGKSTYSETVNGIKLDISSGTNFYTGARDAKGNSCFKLGTSSKTGSFKINVPSNVTEVVIYVAKYKSNTTKISVNNVAYTLTKNSNNGEYDAIKIDTTTNKTITFTTVSGGVRAMVNTIEFNGYIQ